MTTRRSRPWWPLCRRRPLRLRALQLSLRLRPLPAVALPLAGPVLGHDRRAGRAVPMRRASGGELVRAASPCAAPMAVALGLRGLDHHCAGGPALERGPTSRRAAETLLSRERREALLAAFHEAPATTRCRVPVEPPGRMPFAHGSDRSRAAGSESGKLSEPTYVRAPLLSDARALPWRTANAVALYPAMTWAADGGQWRSIPPSPAPAAPPSAGQGADGRAP